MKDYMEYDTLEERLMHMVFGFTVSPDHKIALSEELTKTVSEILDELTERERVVLLNHIKDGETVEEQAAKYEVEEDEIRSVIAKALRKIRYPKRSKRLAVFIKYPGEDRIEKIFEKNPGLMEAYYLCGLVYYYFVFNYVVTEGGAGIGIRELIAVWCLSTVLPDFGLALLAVVLSRRLIRYLPAGVSAASQHPDRKENGR